jgi:cell division septation protein DedD
MGLIKNRVLIAFLLFLVPGMEQWAQNSWQTGSDPWQFGSEIITLEQRLANPNIPAFDRYEALVRLARLRQLSGNLSAAAANWLDAAAVNPGDDSALVAGAYCLTAIGEFEKASQVIQPIITSGRRGPAALQAYYLDAYFKTWFFTNASPLAALAADPEFASLRPMVYYTLWQIIARSPNISGAGSADSWKARLIAEFPGSPEALIAGSGGASVSAVQSPLWMLFPGASGQGARPTTPAAQPATPPRPVTPAPVTPSPTPPATPPANTSSGVVLQTGVFSSENNARNQVEALRKAGFTATISRKLVNGAERWAVMVPAGQSTNRTMQDLKRAGFDSFPVK